jgi:hypothetical protein
VVRGPEVPDDSATNKDPAAPRPRSRLQIPLQQVAGTQSFMLDVHWLDEPRRKAQLKLLAQANAYVPASSLTSDSVSTGVPYSAQRVLAQATIPIDIVRYIDVMRYFWMGIAGVLTGWSLRVLLFAQSKVTPPNPEPMIASSEGVITRFIGKHYYFVDAVLTVTLGGLVLLALVTDGCPPDTADSSIAAYLMGVALGALTNSELLLKIRR